MPFEGMWMKNDELIKKAPPVLVKAAAADLTHQAGLVKITPCLSHLKDLNGK
jgi:hypothetical protein